MLGDNAAEARRDVLLETLQRRIVIVFGPSRLGRDGAERDAKVSQAVEVIGVARNHARHLRLFRLVPRQQCSIGRDVARAPGSLLDGPSTPALAVAVGEAWC